MQALALLSVKLFEQGFSVALVFRRERREVGAASEPRAYCNRKDPELRQNAHLETVPRVAPELRWIGTPP